ncbi:MAG: hypothetical protein K8T26_11340 [Lentisphaerae bacterium]|nr:hypothetical protein [Lentisphaerota bacterium]
MNQSFRPIHLPKPPRNPVAYQRLYAPNCNVDEFSPLDGEFKWQEIRIPRDSSAEEVYLSLPSAPDFEYGGYLTGTRIRYARFGASWAATISSKPCTFHSHPSCHPNCDMPSPRDVYQFLKWRQLRTITVGNHWIWVWTKDQKNAETVKRLLAWEEQNMVPVMADLFRSNCPDPLLVYIERALRQLNYSPPRRRLSEPLCWASHLRDVLGMKTWFISRGTRSSSAAG